MSITWRSRTFGHPSHCSTPGHRTVIDENEVRGATPTLIRFAEQFRSWREEPVWRVGSPEGRAEARFEGRDFWLILTSQSGARIAICCASTFGPAKLIQDGRLGNKQLFAIEGPLGRQEIQIEAEPKKGFVHWRTTLRPKQDVRIASWPCDLYPLDQDGNPLGTRGVVHTKQHGARAAFLFASAMRPAACSWLYFQDLTALNPYFDRTGATPADRITSQWPELGFSLPPTGEKTLQKGISIVISDGYLLANAKVPADTEAAADLFLELYAEMYLRLPRPEAGHRDWPRRVDETVYDLTNSPGCTVTSGGRRYLRAYFAQDNSPPESMVQLAVLVPLLEYAASRGEKIPLIRELESNIPTFFNRTIGSIGRWLPGTESWFQEHHHREDQEGENIMDSWYLYHTHLNLSRLAATGNRTARRLFLKSLEYGIKVARHFGYRWPILFDIYSLKVIRSEEAPGKGGEGDVGAQYVHIMQQAWNLTRDQRYIEEAELAAQCLQGLGFELGYQYNNTSFGAGALMWLWKHTGKELYRELSAVCMANIVQNFWLWQCEYGHAKHYGTFMGMPPLRNAPYLALYEELEMLAAFHEYFALAGEDAHPALRVLLPEYCKYLICRAWYHYPSEIPHDLLADKPKSGKLERAVSIPLEDLYDGWSKAGQVGQQVYGAAAPFVFATRHFHRVPKQGFAICCDYPIRDFCLKPGNATFQLEGDRRCQSHVRVVAENFEPLPKIRLFLDGSSAKGELTALGHWEFAVPGNARVRVEWQRASKPLEAFAHCRNGHLNGRDGAPEPMKTLRKITRTWRHTSCKPRN